MILYHARGNKYVGCANPIRESPPSLGMFQKCLRKQISQFPVEPQ